MVHATRGGRYAAALAILSLSALLLTPFYFRGQIDEQREFVVRTLDPIRDGASDVRLAVAREVAAIRGYLLSGDRALISEYVVTRDAEERAIQAMQRVPALDERLRTLVAALETETHRWNVSNDELAAGKIGRADAIARLGTQIDRYRAALDAGEAIEDEYTSRIALIRTRVIDVEHNWTTASIVLAVI